MKRYNSVAVSLHWLIALMIAGLIVVAKISHSLAEDDPLRFELIQWHKSFGIAVLLLVALRIFWRLTHKPPPLPASTKVLEKFAASAAHLGLYALMIAMPLTGWAMVSASPLNLATELFGAIPWPHLPGLADIADKELWEHRFKDLHHLLANAMLALVLLHALAALRHQFVLKDGVLSRMTIAGNEQGNHGVLFGCLIAAVGALGLLNLTDRQPLVAPVPQHGVTAVVNTVEFSASQMGEPLAGVFENHEITLQLDDADLAAATLSAVVETASVNTGDGQVDATVVTANWFASETYPRATFTSQSISAINDAQYSVAGELVIRDIAKQIEFVMQRQEQGYRGEFAVDRREFGVGVGGQDNFVGPEVVIRFQISQ